MNVKPNMERRGEPRHKTRVEAVMLHTMGRSHVMILDYQDTGLQLWVRDILLPGSKIRLQVGDFQVDGRVLWSKSKSAGISLNAPMEQGLRDFLDASRA